MVEGSFYYLDSWCYLYNYLRVQAENSDMRYLTTSHLNLLDDIWSFDKNHPNDSLAVQNAIGPHIHRHDITIMAEQHTGECRPPKSKWFTCKIYFTIP